MSSSLLNYVHKPLTLPIVTQTAAALQIINIQEPDTSLSQLSPDLISCTDWERRLVPISGQNSSVSSNLDLLIQSLNLSGV
jgi:hypothetical protein